MPVAEYGLLVTSACLGGTDEWAGERGGETGSALFPARSETRTGAGRDLFGAGSQGPRGARGFGNGVGGE